MPPTDNGGDDDTVAYHTINKHVDLSEIARGPSTSVYPTLLTNDIDSEHPIVWLDGDQAQNINLNIDPRTSK